jgi:hypothetical protein
MSRFVPAALLGIVFVLTSSTANAQYGRMFMGTSPLYVYPNAGGGYSVGLNFGINAMTPYGPMQLGYVYPYNLGSPSSYVPEPVVMPSWSGGYGYMTGGSYSAFGGQSDLANAQKEAMKARKTQEDAKELIDAQWAYEKLGAAGPVAARASQDQAEELQKALEIRDPAEVASGAALNRILVAIVVAEGKGAKGVSAFLPPQLLEDVRFSGGPQADLLNMVRQSGKLPFPANFPGPKLAALSIPVEADFAAAVAPLLTGRSVDPTKVTKLEAAVKRLEDAAPPVIRNLPFDDAIAARRFLNQLNSAIKALRGTNLSGLINSKWATDGISVADLVKHMTKHKVMFGPAPSGSEGSYTSLHKALATYLFVLTQAKK